jgi:NCS1 family nucleobase:cation symporter-1
MLADYFLIRRTELDHKALLQHDGVYGYRGGWTELIRMFHEFAR